MNLTSVFTHATTYSHAHTRIQEEEAYYRREEEDYEPKKQPQKRGNCKSKSHQKHTHERMENEKEDLLTAFANNEIEKRIRDSIFGGMDENGLQQRLGDNVAVNSQPLTVSTRVGFGCTLLIYITSRYRATIEYPVNK